MARFSLLDTTEFCVEIYRSQLVLRKKTDLVSHFRVFFGQTDHNGIINVKKYERFSETKYITKLSCFGYHDAVSAVKTLLRASLASFCIYVLRLVAKS